VGESINVSNVIAEQCLELHELVKY